MELSEYSVPVKQLPSPNAYDYYVKAFEEMPELRETPFITPERLEGGAKPPAPPFVERKPVPEDEPDDPAVPLADKIARLPAYEEALATLREGFNYGYASPRVADVTKVRPVYFGLARRMTKVLAMEAFVAREQGDYGRAISTHLDGLHLGTDISNGLHIDVLVGIVLNAIQLARVELILEKLSAEDARSAAKRLEGITRRRVTPEQIAREERHSSLGTMAAILSKPGWRTALRTQDYEVLDEPPGLIERAHDLLVSATWTKQGLFDSTDKDTQIAIERSTLPYPQLRTLPIPKSGAGESVLWALNSIVLRLCADKAMTDQLLLRLALRAYKLEKKKHPDTLSELVPEYLKIIPDDPFGTGAYAYRLKGDSYLLYSFGPDCKDDGGTPLNTPHVLKDSLGDIPAGWMPGRPGAPSTTADN